MTNIRARQPYARRPAPQNDLKPFLDTELANIQRAVPVPLVRAVFADDVVMATDDTIAADATAGSIAITLPPPDRLLYLRVTITRTDTSGNDVVVSGAIPGAPSFAVASGDFITFQSNGTAWLVFERSPAVVDVTRFGAVADWNGTTGTDNWAAFTAAIAAFPHDTGTNRASRGGRLLIPNGRYYLSQTLVLDKQVTLEGGGAGGWEYASGVELVFPKNVTGIRVYALTDSPSGTSGTYSVVRGVYLYCKEKDVSGIGIDISAQVTLEQVGIENFAGHGVRIKADASLSQGNANGWMASFLEVSGCGGDGFHVEGDDANVGCATRVFCSVNGGYGFYESSGTGNRYEACLTEANGLAPYHCVRSSNSSTFDDCYTEDNGAEIDYPSQVIGGVLSTRLSAGSTAFVFKGGLSSRRQFRHEQLNGVATQFFQAGDLSIPSTIMGFGTDAEAGLGYSIDYDSTNKRYRFLHANSASRDPIALPATGSTQSTRGLIGPIFRNGYYNNTAFTGYASAAPVSGTWNQDDVIYKIGATAGGFIGWVCTTAGTPGTWKTFGAISP